MPWSQIIDQERATDALGRALASGRIPHAVLFHGPSGTGKLAAALAFAQALECERRGTPAGPEGDACGTCLPCTKVARMLHPDVRVYLPFPRVSKAPKDDRPSDYAERVRLVGTDPYGAFDYRSRAKLDGDEPSNKQVEHRRLPMEEPFRPEMRRYPVEGRHVVGILPDADRIRKEAANSILKLLEEPAPSVVLILLAERLESVLPTIVSRCQRVRFDPLAPEAIEHALIARERVDPSAAAVAARMADGSYMRARQLVGSEELGALREMAVDFVEQSYVGRAGTLQPLVDKVLGSGAKARKRGSPSSTDGSATSSWFGLLATRRRSSTWIRRRPSGSSSRTSLRLILRLWQRKSRMPYLWSRGMRRRPSWRQPSPMACTTRCVGSLARGSWSRSTTLRETAL